MKLKSKTLTKDTAMKRFLNILGLAVVALAFSTALAHAGSPRDLSAKSIFEFPVAAPTPASGDYTLYWDDSIRSFVRINASQSAVITRVFTGTVANGQTGATVPAAGVTASSRCFVTPTQQATNSVSVRSVVTSANQFVLNMTGDPGASNMTFAALCIN